MKEQTSSGNGNVQVIGNGNVISQGQPDRPQPDNPNLITCPACQKYGIYRDADVCPFCHYSFLNERLAAQTAARKDREKGLQLLALFAVGAVAIAVMISDKFAVGFLKSLVAGAVSVYLLYAVWLLLRVTLARWIKKW